MYTFVNLHVHIYIYTNIYIYIYIYIYLHMHIYIYTIFIYIYMYLNKYPFIFIYIYIQTRYVYDIIVCKIIMYINRCICFYRDMLLCMDNCREMIYDLSRFAGVTAPRLLTKVEGVEGLAQHFGYEAPSMSTVFIKWLFPSMVP